MTNGAADVETKIATGLTLWALTDQKVRKRHDD